ncbi:MAG: hypothetical protein ABJB01_12470 [Rudaea sp.]
MSWPRLALAALVIFAVNAVATEPDWTVRVTPYDGIYPSLELSQARRRTALSPTDHTLGGGSGLVAVEVKSRRASESIALSMQIPDFDRPARFAASLQDADIDYSLHPPLDWNLPQLRTLTSPRSTRLTVAMTRDGHNAGTRNVDVTVHPLGEALYFVRDGRDSVDLSWIFAAYVDEHDPVVDSILDAAAASEIVEPFAGYANADPTAVYRQVWAVWHVLSARSIRYSTIDPAIERGPKVFSQRVRFLADTWNDRSANCIDGSVLIASVLQRIGIRTFLVLVPGHAFIGFYTDPDAQHAAYLETTLIGATVAMPTRKPDFADDVTLTPENRKSLASFSAALAAGRAHHLRVAGKLDGRHRPNYAVIDIAAARAFGIRPIAEDDERLVIPAKAGIR